MSTRSDPIVARVVGALAALAGIAVTLPFAAAFHAAYGSGSDQGLVTASVTPWLSRHGLLGFDSAAVYDRYGVAYLVALGLVTACVAVLTPSRRVGRQVLLAGLVVLCAGVFGDYAVSNDAVGGIGFLLEGVGLLVAAVGFGLVVHEQRGVAAGVGAALVALGCMVAGAVATGHIPSGPGLVVFAGALGLALLREEIVMELPGATHPSPSTPAGGAVARTRDVCNAARSAVQTFDRGGRLLMAGAERKSFDEPDEVREFPNGRAAIVNIGGGQVSKMTLQPGWRWSTDVKPAAGTELCEAPHFQYVLAGRVGVRMADGTELEIKPDDVNVLPPGHDAWVIGDEEAVAVDWGGAHLWGRPSD